MLPKLEKWQNLTNEEKEKIVKSIKAELDNDPKQKTMMEQFWKEKSSK